MLPLDRIAAIIFSAATLCAIAYYMLAIWSATRSSRKGDEPRAKFLPPVSILKPVYGANAGAYECFRSHCLQDYPEYEIIFALNEASDPVLPLIEQLQREFPERSIRIAVCPDVYGTNRKVGKLIHVLPQARYQHLIINDGDVRVPPDYLQRVMEPFSDDDVGMVTCLYRGVAGSTMGSKLEALGINTDFAAGVLVARQMERGLHFGLGATLALSRDALARIGGFEALMDYLADDYELGARISQAGYKVLLSQTVVDVLVTDYSFPEFFEHQLRWGRGMRSSRPAGYRGLPLTFGLLWGSLAVIASHGAAAAWVLLALALLARSAMAFTVGKGVLGSNQVMRDLWLLPLRDLVAVAVWVGSYTGRKVVWGRKEFILQDGKLRSIG